MAFDTPILLIAFSRADTAVAVINSVRQVKPSNLYLACDGPRNQVVGEEELCRLTRDAIEAAIDWPCKVHRLRHLLRNSDRRDWSIGEWGYRRC